MDPVRGNYKLLVFMDTLNSVSEIIRALTASVIVKNLMTEKKPF